MLLVGSPTGEHAIAPRDAFTPNRFTAVAAAFDSLTSSRFAAVALGCLVGATTASAGVSLDEVLARDRALAGERGATLTPIELEPDGADDLTLAIGGLGDGIPPLARPLVRGDGGVRLRTRTALGDGAVRLRLGVSGWAGDRHPLSFDESSISVAFGPGRAYASVERRHWGPSWTGSLILDGASRPVPAIGWRKTDPTAFRTPWLAWLGPWSLDAFAGQIGQRTGPAHAKLLGARLQIMPLAGLELAASRTIQWGGKGRPESFRSLAKALLGKDNVDSTDPSSPSSDEPGNQLAGFDARYSVPIGERTFSIYGQAIGEDESGNLPSHYLANVGADVAFRVGELRSRVFVERANTTMSGAFGAPLLGSAYRHHIYTAGYTQQGSPLGHPAGGDVTLNSIGALVDAQAVAARVMVHRGSAYTTAQLYPGGGRLAGESIEVAAPLGADAQVGVLLARWRDLRDTRIRAQLWVRQSFR